AEGGHGAVGAAGGAGGADEGAQLHQGLVVGRGVGRVEEGLGEGPLAPGAGGAVDRVVLGDEAGEDAGDVAVDQGGGEAEGDGGDGAGGVAADAGQGEQGLVVGRDDAAVAGDDLAGAGLQVTAAAVVAEAGPQGEDVGLGGGGQGGDVGEGGQEAVEVGDDGGDLC